MIEKKKQNEATTKRSNGDTIAILIAKQRKTDNYKLQDTEIQNNLREMVLFQ